MGYVVEHNYVLKQEGCIDLCMSYVLVRRKTLIRLWQNRREILHLIAIKVKEVFQVDAEVEAKADVEVKVKVMSQF